MTGLLVGADDRTGALETAGSCADAGLAATVVTAGGVGLPCGPPAPACVVVDLATRHMDAGAAAAAATTLDAAWPVAWRAAHKIDSTLRGNWAAELVARHRVGGWAVLVVPASPAVGRTCAGGTVLVDGHPVGDGPPDARRPVMSSRPAEHLRAAGAPEVTELSPGGLETWKPNLAPFAVCDAATGADLARIAAWWSTHPGVLLAGSAAAIGAAAVPLSAGAPAPTPAVAPLPRSPALVVCGSLHPTARAQVAALVEMGAEPVVAGADPASPGPSAVAALRAGRHVVVVPGTPPSLPVPASEATRTAGRLAGAAHALLAGAPVRTLILVGGDTAAAVLGPDPVTVGGTVAPGVAWFHRGAGTGPLVLTKPGGFGHPGLLVDLLHGRAENAPDDDCT